MTASTQEGGASALPVVIRHVVVEEEPLHFREWVEQYIAEREGESE